MKSPFRHFLSNSEQKKAHYNLVDMHMAIQILKLHPSSIHFDVS